jgi:hypothetical protein
LFPFSQRTRLGKQVPFKGVESILVKVSLQTWRRQTHIRKIGRKRTATIAASWQEQLTTWQQKF